MYRIERDAETGALSLTRRSSQAFDAARRPIEVGDDRDGEARRSQAVLLIALGGVGLAGLWSLARHRRPEPGVGVA